MALKKDTSKQTKETKALKEPLASKRNSSFEESLELSFSNLEKIYWPEEGYSKGDLIEYYQKIAPYILPYLKDRPQSLHRFPNGIEAKGFFQKNIDERFPDWLSTFPVQHEEGERNYLLINNLKSLLFAVNLGCIELNPFNSRIQNLYYPDYMVIDLDPEAIDFEAVIETARTFHEVLAAQDIPSFCKTSGATGLHIYVPLAAKYPYDQVKLFAQLLGEIVHELLPSITSVERSPAKRQGRVYLDYLQNNFGQTLVSPYSVRPRKGAPVSTPLDWSEVKAGLDPSSFTMKNILRRLKKRGDLFLPILGAGVNLLSSLKKLQN